ncbi:MAG TPA: hypothetical protein VLF87_01890 [Patescibacteria group bacterium]|nr:hypothetical protein [Patescibacteria group bacterium]
MAETTITHFKEFDPERVLAFADKVMQTVGVEVYGIEYGETTPENVTLIVNQAGPGSKTSASSGTEVKIDLDDEEWPGDATGVPHTFEAAKDNCLQLKYNIGQSLLGGVNEAGEAIVNVWVRQFPATGWYGAFGYEGREQ